MGGVASVAVGLMQLGARLAGALQTRHGTAKVVAVGCFFSASGLALAAATTRVWHLYASFGVLMGFGHSLMFPPFRGRAGKLSRDVRREGRHPHFAKTAKTRRYRVTARSDGGALARPRFGFSAGAR